MSQSVQLASIPTEPEAILVYVLLAGSLWLIWKGNQSPKPEQGTTASDAATGGEESKGPAEASRAEEGDAGAGEPARAGSGSSRKKAKADRSRRKGKKLSKAQRRRRGDINWIS